MAAAEYLVEFFGTIFFVFVVLKTGSPWAIGAALALAVWVGGPISGGNFNPAVAFASYAGGRLSGAKAIYYSLCEIAGAAVAVKLNQITPKL